MKKNSINLFFLAFSTIALLFACKKEETKINYTGGNAPVLTTNVADNDTLLLVPSDSSKSLFSFSWTNPDYTFTDGLSSQNVNYYIQLDTLGSNFSKAQSISVGGSGLDTTLTVGSINAILGNGLLLPLGQTHNIQIRVQSFLGSNAVPLNSNVFNYVITPYAPPPKVAPPYTYPDNPQGTLYIVGDATAGNWDNPIDKVPPASQQFMQNPTDPTDYTITIALAPGGTGYKFIGVNGSWAEQWSVKTDNDPTEKNGGSFVFNGNNIAPPDAAGTYLIDVNFQTGIFTVTPK